MCQKENPTTSRNTASLAKALKAFRIVDVACLTIERRRRLLDDLERQIRGSSVAIESLQTSIEIFESQIDQNRPNCEYERKRMEEHHVDLLVQKSSMLSHHASLQRAYLQMSPSADAKESLHKERSRLMKILLQYSIEGCHIQHRILTTRSHLNDEKIAQSLWHSATEHLSLAVSEIDLSLFCDKILGDNQARAPQTYATSQEHMERAMLLISSAGKLLNLDTATVLSLFASNGALDVTQKKSLYLSVRACLDDLQAIASRRDQEVHDLQEHSHQLHFEGLEHCRQLVASHL